MSAAEDGDVADGHVAAQLQRDGFVARAYGAALHVAALLRVALGKPLTVNHTPSSNTDVLLAVSPYQAVVEIGVTTVLVFRTPEDLALVVGFHAGRRRYDDCSRRQVQLYVALHPDAATQVASGRQYHASAASSMGCRDGTVHGFMVQGTAVTRSTVVLNVVVATIGPCFTRYCQHQQQHRHCPSHHCSHIGCLSILAAKLRLFSHNTKPIAIFFLLLVFFLASGKIILRQRRYIIVNN